MTTMYYILYQLQQLSMLVDHKQKKILCFLETVHWTHLITMSANSHEKVIWFDVPVDEVLIVDILYSSNHLGGMCVCVCVHVCENQSVVQTETRTVNVLVIFTHTQTSMNSAKT